VSSHMSGHTMCCSIAVCFQVFARSHLMFTFTPHIRIHTHQTHGVERSVQATTEAAHGFGRGPGPLCRLWGASLCVHGDFSHCSHQLFTPHARSTTRSGNGEDMKCVEPHVGPHHVFLFRRLFSSIRTFTPHVHIHTSYSHSHPPNT
jgi:hypothetical protein